MSEIEPVWTGLVAKVQRGIVARHAVLKKLTENRDISEFEGTAAAWVETQSHLTRLAHQHQLDVAALEESETALATQRRHVEIYWSALGGTAIEISEKTSEYLSETIALAPSDRLATLFVARDLQSADFLQEDLLAIRETYKNKRGGFKPSWRLPLTLKRAREFQYAALSAVNRSVGAGAATFAIFNNAHDATAKSAITTRPLTPRATFEMLIHANRLVQAGVHTVRDAETLRTRSAQTAGYQQRVAPYERASKEFRQRWAHAVELDLGLSPEQFRALTATWAEAFDLEQLLVIVPATVEIAAQAESFAVDNNLVPVSDTTINTWARHIADHFLDPNSRLHAGDIQARLLSGTRLLLDSAHGRNEVALKGKDSPKDLHPKFGPTLPTLTEAE